MSLGYVILYVPDVAAAAAFYERAFDLAVRFAHEGGEYTEMETGATALAFVAEGLAEQSCPGFRRNRPGEAPAGSEIGLIHGDVPAAYARAIAAGAESVLEPTTKPWGQVVSYVRDLNGCLVEICSAVGG
jgi:uncharacterized glyoxalase superfamily protein PhnB